MKVTKLQQTREESARLEIGETIIRPGVTRFLVLFFVMVIYSVPVLQCVNDYRLYLQDERNTPWPQAFDFFREMPPVTRLVAEARNVPAGIFEANRHVLRHINEFEDDLEDESYFGKAVRPAAQYIMARWLGVGNELAYIGRERWLFFRPTIDYLTGPGFLDPHQLERRAAAGTEWRPAPQPDPRRAIRQFNDQLAERGITLIVMPVPVKASVHPEQFTARYDEGISPLQNPSYRRFVDELKADGIPVFDISQAIHERKRRTGDPQFLSVDTHWRPETVVWAAGALKRFIEHEADLPRREPLQLRYNYVEVDNLGDIAFMLDLPAQRELFHRERVQIRQITTGKGNWWRPSDDADILVLGDSFSNIYSLEPMGWGESAGLIEQLSYELGRPIDRIVRNDDGAHATRALLSRELARGSDRLEGKRVVVWQFAARELSVGNWELLDMNLRDPEPTEFFTPEPGDEVVVRGIVQNISNVPRPGTVPYRDHIVSMHLVDLEHEDTEIRDRQTVVYMSSMIDNELTAAARFRRGDRVEIRLRSWDDVADRYEAMNRSELDEWELQLVEPSWGELE